MTELLQSTAQTVVGRGYLSSDHISTATGLDPAITISKNGGNFANPAAGASVMTEIESTGWYKFALGTGDTDTLGPLLIRGTHATMDNIEVVFQVVAVSVAQTGDAYARLGAPAGASVSADIADLPTVTEFNARTIAAADYTVVSDLGTVQTGDAYAVVNHADYGNAKLVRSTTPANTLTVDASHQALSLTNAVSNDAITAAAIANGAIDAATFAAGAIDAAAIADNAIDNGALAADAISAAKINADVTTELQSGLATATAALILATPANKLTTDASGRVEVSGTKNTLDDLNDLATGAEMTLTAAYDAAKTAATQTSVDDLPTVSEFEARTIPSADYTVVGDLPSEPDNASIAAILEDTGTTLDTLIKDLPTNAELTTALAGADDTVLAAIAGLNDITVADIIAGITEGSLDLQEILRIILAAVAGKASGGGTATIKFRDQADTLDRITATVDENGNRSAVVVDGS